MKLGDVELRQGPEIDAKRVAGRAISQHCRHRNSNQSKAILSFHRAPRSNCRESLRSPQLLRKLYEAELLSTSKVEAFLASLRSMAAQAIFIFERFRVLALKAERSPDGWVSPRAALKCREVEPSVASCSKSQRLIRIVCGKLFKHCRHRLNKQRL